MREGPPSRGRCQSHPASSSGVLAPHQPLPWHPCKAKSHACILTPPQPSPLVVAQCHHGPPLVREAVCVPSGVTGYWQSRHNCVSREGKHAHLICPMAVFCPVPTTAALALPAVTTVPCIIIACLKQNFSKTSGQAHQYCHTFSNAVAGLQKGALPQRAGRSCPDRRLSDLGPQLETSQRSHSPQSRWTAVRHTTSSECRHRATASHSHQTECMPYLKHIFGIRKPVKVPIG